MKFSYTLVALQNEFPERGFLPILSSNGLGRFILPLGLLVFTLVLASCGSNSTVLSNVQLSPADGKLILGNPTPELSLNYDIGQNSHFTAFLTAPDGKHYNLRQNDIRTPGHYTLDFNGVVTVSENGLTQQRLLADGTYTYTLEAQADSNGVVAQQSGQLNITNSQALQPVPVISNLSANPAVISPNFDAVDDVTHLNWQTSQPATITVSISGADGVVRELQKPKLEPAQASSVVFDGLDLKGAPLPDGVYTYTVQAADKYGNVSQAASRVTLKGGGKPEAAISSVEFTPNQVIKGGEITVTIKVKNTGKVPLRTQGPDSGYTYDSRDTYRNIENGKYDYKAGFWRVGVATDADNNYPYRWGFGHDLQPGEEATIVGHIIVNENDTKLTFYAGLLQEQIAIKADHIGITTIKISS